MEGSKKEEYMKKYQAYQKKVLNQTQAENKEKEDKVELDYKDYIAFSIALFESVFFPILVVIGIFLFFVFILYLFGL